MTATILIVDDEENARLFIQTHLTNLGYETITASTHAEAREIINHGNPDIILLDIRLPDGNGLRLLEEMRHMSILAPIILMTAFGDIEQAVEAMKNGAFDFLTKPIKFPELDKSIQKAEEIVAMKRELTYLRQARDEHLDFIIGHSQKMKKILDYAKRAAAASVSVLITGETGTGKEVLANSIHKAGPRANKQFIAINCAAIQTTVLESELFGYEAGAFTGAEKRKHGLMEAADGGILFLDEISTMPVEMQAKLLRVLEEHAFRRVGGTNLIHVDVQILAASNRDLPTLMKEGKFGVDLYYRLKVVDLHIPPLRERKQDIPELVGLFIRKNNPRMGLNVEGVTPRAMECLLAHNWPGNIRELKNVIEQAMLFCDDALIDLPQLPSEMIIPSNSLE